MAAYSKSQNWSFRIYGCLLKKPGIRFFYYGEKYFAIANIAKAKIAGRLYFLQLSANKMFSIYNSKDFETKAELKDEDKQHACEVETQVYRALKN